MLRALEREKREKKKDKSRAENSAIVASNVLCKTKRCGVTKFQEIGKHDVTFQHYSRFVT